MINQGLKKYQAAAEYARQIPEDDKIGDWKKSVIESAKWSVSRRRFWNKLLLNIA